MGELFSDNWMQALQKKWNADPNIIEPLHKAQFSARIAYGFKKEPYHAVFWSSNSAK